MSKEEVLNILVELYKNTSRDEVDTMRLREIAEYINFINDDKKILDTLDSYERLTKQLADGLSVTKLANMCGTSRVQIYRLLGKNSKLHILRKYQEKM